MTDAIKFISDTRGSSPSYSSGSCCTPKARSIASCGGAGSAVRDLQLPHLEQQFITASVVIARSVTRYHITSPHDLWNLMLRSV